jgi:hypothetical protein
MANTLNNTLNKISDTAGAVSNPRQYNNPNRVYANQTCLERFGMEARSAHLMRNEWNRDLQYTKLLVDAEYLIQTEFKVSSYEDRLSEQEESKAKKQKELSEKEIKKIEEKRDKAKEKYDNYSKILEERKQSKEKI